MTLRLPSAALALSLIFAGQAWSQLRDPDDLIGLLGAKGEWVTSERDGTKICRLSRDLHAGEIAHARGWCEAWSIPEPLPHTPIEGDWVRITHSGALQLHFENGWR